MSVLVDFHLNRGTTQSGYTLSDIYELDTDELESNHDYIQWLFPSPEESQAVPGSPVLTQADFDRLHGDVTFMCNLYVRSRVIFLEFLSNYDYWKSNTDHNHLRITRAIKCISLFFGYDVALKMYNEIVKKAVVVSDVSNYYWWNAVDFRENQKLIKVQN